MKIQTVTPDMSQMTESASKNWKHLIGKLGDSFEAKCDKHDAEDEFVAQNYAALKEIGFFAAAIPESLGGGGVPHSEMCDLIRMIGQSCGSTALASSMHQHLLGAMIWKFNHGKGGEETLMSIAAKQPILVSTGARDWLESNGEMKRVDGGYSVSAIKHFASQSAVGDIMVTSSTYNDPEQGPRVLHFAVPFAAQGLTVLNNWKAMGMRGTGSHSVKLDNVFVPDSAISLERAQGEFHPLFNVILTVAMPLIMSAYVGIAQRAAKIAIGVASPNPDNKPYTASLVGAMGNQLTIAELNWKDMVRIANDLDFDAVQQNSHDILSRKTNVANACIATVSQAMEIVGGQGFHRRFGMERLFRDVQAAHYHPMQEQDQLIFSGQFLMDQNSNH